MQVYINYPNPHITIHQDVNCGQIQMHNIQNQRQFRVRMSNLRSTLKDFQNNKHLFKAEQFYNDMWLDISLDTIDQEIGLIHVLQAILGQKYSPLADAPVNRHC